MDLATLRRAALLTALALPACTAGRFTPVVHGAPRAVAVEREHDFGSVPPGVRVEHRFEIANRGDRVLEIRGIEAACGCETALAGADTVQPGRTGGVVVRLDTKGRSGPTAVWARVRTNDPAEPELRLLLYGEVAAPVRVLPAKLLIGHVPRHSVGSGVVEVELARPGVRIESIRASSRRLRVRAERLEPPARGVRLHVTLRPRGRRGLVNDRIVVETTSALEPEVVIPVLAVFE